MKNKSSIFKVIVMVLVIIFAMGVLSACKDVIIPNEHGSPSVPEVPQPPKDPVLPKEEVLKPEEGKVLVKLMSSSDTPLARVATFLDGKEVGKTNAYGQVLVTKPTGYGASAMVNFDLSRFPTQFLGNISIMNSVNELTCTARAGNASINGKSPLDYAADARSIKDKGVFNMLVLPIYYGTAPDGYTGYDSQSRERISSQIQGFKQTILKKSYGRLNVVTTVLDDIEIKDSKYLSDPNNANDGLSDEGIQYAIDSAVAKNPDVEWKNFDNNGDGEIDTINLAFSNFDGRGMAWAGDSSYTLKGVKISKFTWTDMVNSLNTILSHEFFHTLGLPDTYSRMSDNIGQADDGEGLGVMNSNYGVLNPFFGYMLGWSSPTILNLNELTGDLVLNLGDYEETGESIIIKMRDDNEYVFTELLVIFVVTVNGEKKTVVQRVNADVVTTRWGLDFKYDNTASSRKFISTLNTAGKLWVDRYDKSVNYYFGEKYLSNSNLDLGATCGMDEYGFYTKQNGLALNLFPYSKGVRVNVRKSNVVGSDDFKITNMNMKTVVYENQYVSGGDANLITPSKNPVKLVIEFSETIEIDASKVVLKVENQSEFGGYKEGIYSDNDIIMVLGKDYTVEKTANNILEITWLNGMPLGEIQYNVYLQEGSVRNSSNRFMGELLSFRTGKSL